MKQATNSHRPLQRANRAWRQKKWPWVVAFVFGFCFVVCFLLFGGWYFFGPERLALKRDFQLKHTLSKAYPDLRIKIGQISLIKKPLSEGGVGFGLSKVEARDHKGHLVVIAPSVDASVKVSSLLFGQIVPTAVKLNDAQLKLQENNQGQWAISHKLALSGERGDEDILVSSTHVSSQGESPLDDQWVGRKIMQIRNFLSQQDSLQTVGVTNAQVILKGQRQTETWVIPSFEFSADDGADGDLTGEGKAQRKNWDDNKQIDINLAQKAGQKHVQVTARFSNLKFEDLSDNFPKLTAMSRLSNSVSGQMKTDIGFNGTIHDLKIDVNLGHGQIYPRGLGNISLPVDEGVLSFTYDRSKNAVEIHKASFDFPGGHAVFHGNAELKGQSTGYRFWDFDLTLDEGAVLTDAEKNKSSQIDQLIVKGAFLPQNSSFEIDHLRFASKKGRLWIDEKAAPQKREKKLLVGGFEDLSLPLIKNLWPKNIKPEQRQWLFERLHSGTLGAGTFTIENQQIGSGQQAPHFNLSAKVRDFTFRANKKFPPLKSSSVSLKMSDKQLSLTIPKGEIGDKAPLKIKDGAFEVSNFTKANPKGQLQFASEGKISSFEKLFGFALKDDKQDLQFLRTAKGRVTGTTKMAWPLKADLKQSEIILAGNYKINDFHAQLRNTKISNGQLNVKFDQAAMTATGDVVIDELPAKINWQHIYGVKKDKTQPIRLNINLSPSQLAKLSPELNKVIDNGGGAEIFYHPLKEVNERTYVKADVTNSTLHIAGLGWKKPAGVRSFIDFYFVPQKSGAKLDKFQIHGDRLTVKGSIDLDEKKKIKKFIFSEVNYNVVSSLAIGGTRSDNGWYYVLSGRSLDGRRFFQNMMSGKQSRFRRSSDKQTIKVDVGIDHIIGFENSALNNVSMSLVQKSGRLTNLSLTGRLKGRGVIKARMGGQNSGAPVLRVDTDNAGEALRLAGIYSNMVGGRGVLSLKLNPAERLVEKRGSLRVSRFGLKQDLVLNEIVAGQQKIQQTAQQGVMPFDRLNIPFSFGQEQLVLHRSFVNGPAIGATLQGRLDYNRQTVQLGGTYIPLYGLNSIVKNVPILGDILVGRKGEGVLGVTYAIVGPMKKPQVIVNPMSLIAPGIFRQIFEFSQKKQKIERRKKLIPSFSKQIKRPSISDLNEIKGQGPGPNITPPVRKY